MEKYTSIREFFAHADAGDAAAASNRSANQQYKKDLESGRFKGSFKDWLDKNKDLLDKGKEFLTDKASGWLGSLFGGGSNKENDGFQEEKKDNIPPPPPSPDEGMKLWGMPAWIPITGMVLGVAGVVVLVVKVVKKKPAAAGAGA